MKLNVDKVAKKVAQNIMNRVDANPEDFADYDGYNWEDVDAFVQHEIQDFLPDLMTEISYEELSEALNNHLAVLTAIETAQDIVSEYLEDQKEWQRGPMKALGLKESDFA